MTPDDFMFEMTDIEFKNWRSQFVTSKGDRMGLRYKPMVFREQGVAMLSSVVRSKKAILVNIQIMRAFIQLRQMYIRHEDLKRKIEVMENKFLSPLSDCVFGGSTKRNMKTLCVLCELEGPKGVGG
jgi:hypothetical protein